MSELQDLTCKRNFFKMRLLGAKTTFCTNDKILSPVEIAQVQEISKLIDKVIEGFDLQNNYFGIFKRRPSRKQLEKLNNDIKR